MRGVDYSGLLQQEGVLLEGHFVLKSGAHSDRYLNKDAVTRVASRWKLAQGLAALARQFDIAYDVVVGPAQAGAIWAQLVALALQQSVSTSTFSKLGFGYAEKDGSGFILRRGFDTMVDGRSVLLVEDIITTGGSIAAVAQAVRACGGYIAAIVALCVRGAATAQSLDVPHLSALVEPHHIQAKIWSEEECRHTGLCAQGVPISTDVGHGEEFLLQRGKR